MTAIAGVEAAGHEDLVKRMLEKMKHRGSAGQGVIDLNGATIGVSWHKDQPGVEISLKENFTAFDYSGNGHFAQAQSTSGGIVLTRGRIGAMPLYFGYTDEGLLCFASEVKGLLEATRDVHEVLPGRTYRQRMMENSCLLEKQLPVYDEPKAMARELRLLLEQAVNSHYVANNPGVWLSGGLDSSVIAALVRQINEKVHTFVAGISGASDLEYASIAARHIQSTHHEIIVSLEEMIAVLPEVIYALESFDALLVRSSIMNYLTAKAASNFVSVIFSGEGGDELFAGYDYLKTLAPAFLADELLDITKRLHNTALQRVDRCAFANGLVPYVIFLDEPVVDYALKIPVEYKLREGVEKWILRQAAVDLLPGSVLHRPKSKFWEGAGVSELISQHAENIIKDKAFSRERKLENGVVLNTKEELLYYRIFKDHFGEFEDLSWVGRTKGAPKSEVLSPN